ncbi:MAG TPA: 3-oxoacyl-[acyl-carrier-protein] synthase III C-terminal domain-containing protein [Methylomirabilota bacterium]|nr:3-oxoacyl-[acyl-carrier-protein] synthase III C-terminal domain-containing protein [Methylomirabilota bacterium]
MSTRTPAPRLTAVATAVPAHAATQAEARALVARMFHGSEAGSERLLAVFDHSGIERRHFCMPLDWYTHTRSFEEQNALYVEHALALGKTAAERALVRAGVTPHDLDHVVFVSTTGIATPSLDARLSLALGCRPECRRTPVWGLGCAGGAAGLARARELALARPGSRVLLVAAELCSLTFRLEDMDKRNLVATSLFADGAAAAVVEGAEAAHRNGAGGLELIGSHSTLWPDTLDMMGWTVSGRGLHVVFSRDIPSFVRERVRPSLEGFLHEHGLSLESPMHVAAHPGGAKVLEAYADALGQPASAFTHAREVLREFGNMSSPTCLFVLERHLASGGIHPGETVLVSALGPGFAAEYVLARSA